MNASLAWPGQVHRDEVTHPVLKALLGPAWYGLFLLTCLVRPLPAYLKEDPSHRAGKALPDRQLFSRCLGHGLSLQHLEGRAKCHGLVAYGLRAYGVVWRMVTSVACINVGVGTEL